MMVVFIHIIDIFAGMGWSNSHANESQFQGSHGHAGFFGEPEAYQ